MYACVLHWPVEFYCFYMGIDLFSKNKKNAAKQGLGRFRYTPDCNSLCHSWKTGRICLLKVHETPCQGPVTRSPSFYFDCSRESHMEDKFLYFIRTDICNMFLCCIIFNYPQAGADLNCTIPDTPLVIATSKGLMLSVRYLLEVGASANIPSNHVSS